MGKGVWAVDIVKLCEISKTIGIQDGVVACSLDIVFPEELECQHIKHSIAIYSEMGSMYFVHRGMFEIPIVSKRTEAPVKMSPSQSCRSQSINLLFDCVLRICMCQRFGERSLVLLLQVGRQTGVTQPTIESWVGVTMAASTNQPTSSSANKNLVDNGHGSYAPPGQILSSPMSALTNGVLNRHNGSDDKDGKLKPESPSLLNDVSNVAELRAALAALHDRESALTNRLDSLISTQADLTRDLGRLDLLRAGLGAQVIAARSISNDMLSSAAETAGRLSNRVKELDLEKSRVEDTLGVVEQVAELKACVNGVVGSMGAPQDWEAAAGYLDRASKVPEEIAKGPFATSIVPSVEVPDPPWVTLETARESLCGLFLREFEKAASHGDGTKVTRFFKLFPLIGRTDVGLDVYGRYVCQGVAGTARATLKDSGGAQERREKFFYANALTRLFEHIAQIVDSHGGLVERHYGAGKMVRVIERLQMEADVQGGIIMDAWSDERSIDRTLTDVKSYPFSFLVQSFLPQPPRGGTPRVNSPAVGGGNNPRSSEDEGVNMKEVDGLLNEIAHMLGRWSLYTRFLSGKCMVSWPPRLARALRLTAS